MNANVKDVVPFLCVASMERSLRYYVDGLGFSMKEPMGRRWNAIWVRTLSDPDGYQINFERKTDTPEDTKLSEVKI